MSLSYCGNLYKDAIVEVTPIPEKPIVYASNNALYTSAVSKYQWYEVADGKITNATNWNLKPEKTGDYYVITSQNECLSEKSTSVHFEYTGPNGIEEHNEIELQFYPNPFSSNLNISSSFEIAKVEMVNSIGSVCVIKKGIKNKAVNINTTSLAKGVYLIKIWPLQNTQSPIVKKLIKE